MQVMTAPRPVDLLDGHRRPTVLEYVAGGLVAASAILHLAAMFPVYFGGSGQSSAWSQPDQAALYSMLTAGWVVALVIGLTGPRRLPAAAGMVVGLAVAELGFRLSDLGQVFRYGTGAAGPGLWVMTAAWVVGAAGSVVAAIAVRRARRSSRAPDTTSAVAAAAWLPENPEALANGSPAEPAVWWAGGSADAPAGLGQGAADDESQAARATSGVAEETATLGGAPAAESTIRLEPTSSFPHPAADAEPPPAGQGDGPAAGQSGAGRPKAGTIALVVILAGATAGAFLPAWDHYTGVVTSTGRSVSFNLGNAFSGPWQVVLGNVVAAVAMVALPVIAITRRDRVVGAALISGMLAVLASQFAAAVVQVGQPVSPSIVGLTPGRAGQLGLQFHLGLTAWFTVDLLVAFALFVTTMLVAFSRTVEPEASPT